MEIPNKLVCMIYANLPNMVGLWMDKPWQTKALPAFITNHQPLQFLLMALCLHGLFKPSESGESLYNPELKATYFPVP